MKIIQQMRTLFSIFRSQKYLALLLFFVMIFSALSESLSLGMIMPFFEAITVSNGQPAGSLKYFHPLLKHFPEYYKTLIIGAIFLMLILLKNILYILGKWLSLKFVFNLRKFWMDKVMGKYMNVEYSYFLSQKQGVLLNNLIAEPVRASKAIQQIIIFFSNAILALFLYALMILAQWQFALILSVITMLIVFSLRKTTYKYSIGVGENQLVLSQKINAIAAESINAIRQIKLFSMGKKVHKEFLNKLDEMLKVLLRFKIISSLPRPINESLIVTIFIAFLLYLQYIKQSSLINIVPVVALYVMISQRFFNIAAQLYADRMTIFTFLPSVKLLYSLGNSDIKDEILDSGKVIDKLEDDIIFDNVSFSYSASKPLFQNLSLVVPEGKITAIVGTSGAGKSTIVDLIVGLVRKQGGRIIINRVDLSEINLSSWRNSIGYVSQDMFIFNATVRENILAGNQDASEDEIIAAAKKANAAQFIERLPQGYDTLLGEKGLKISGGERQRISIARCLIRNPELLIFDEATNALDSESEKLIQKSIDNLKGQKTIIIIAHRLTTIMDADKIIVLDKGKIVEEGMHSELIGMKGLYWRLAENAI